MKFFADLNLRLVFVGGTFVAAAIVVFAAARRLFQDRELTEANGVLEKSILYCIQSDNNNNNDMNEDARISALSSILVREGGIFQWARDNDVFATGGVVTESKIDSYKPFDACAHLRLLESAGLTLQMLDLFNAWVRQLSSQANCTGEYEIVFLQSLDNTIVRVFSMRVMLDCNSAAATAGTVFRMVHIKCADIHDEFF
jgi:hypothetical protein